MDNFQPEGNKTEILQVPVSEIKNEPELLIHDTCDSMDFRENAYDQNVYEIKADIKDNESSGREFLTESESEFLTESESEFQTDVEEEEIIAEEKEMDAEKEEETDTEEEETDTEEEETDTEEEENHHQSKLHSQNEYDLRNLLHVCPICGDEFENENRAAWTSHLADKHELDKVEKLNYVKIPGSISKSSGPHFKCTICEKVFTKNTLHLNNHAYSHMAFPITKCKICGTGSSGYKCPPCNCKGNYIDPHLNCDNCTLLCLKCEAPFENGKQLKIHMSTDHNMRLPEDLNFKIVKKGVKNSTIYKCTKCHTQQRFRGANFDVLLRHAAKHDRHTMYQCNHCKKTFRDIYYFNRHEVTCQTVAISHIKRLCPACGWQWTSQENFEGHIKSVHNLTSMESLNVAKAKDELKKRTEHNKCTQCDHVFQAENMTEYKNHAFQHMPYKMYNCTICEQGFDTQLDITKHLNSEHNVDIYKNTTKYLANLNLIFICPVCNVKLKSKRAQTQHMDKEHQINATLKGLSMKEVVIYNQSGADFKKVYECLECGAQLRNRSRAFDRLQHRISHLPYKQYKCKQCEISFNYIKTFENHIRKSIKLKSKLSPASEGIDKNTTKCRKYLNLIYMCPVCNVELKSKKAQLQHMNKEHQLNETWKSLSMKEVVIYDEKGSEVKKVHECLECGAHLSYKSHSSEHLQHRMSHFPYKPYKCKQCGIALSRIQAIGKHIERCNKLKPTSEEIAKSISKCQEYLNTIFMCPVCNVELKSKKILVQHINKEHQVNTTLEGLSMKKVVIYNQKGAEVKQVYECLECGVQLRNKSYPFDRLQHRMMHLPYKPYKCKLCGTVISHLESIRRHLVKCNKFKPK